MRASAPSLASGAATAKLGAFPGSSFNQSIGILNTTLGCGDAATHDPGDVSLQRLATFDSRR